MATKNFLLLLSVFTLFQLSGSIDFDWKTIVNTFKEKGFEGGVKKAVDELSTREVLQEVLIKALEKVKPHDNDDIIGKVTNYWSGTVQSIQCEVSYSDCNQEDRNEWMVKCMGCVTSHLYTKDQEGKRVSLRDNKIFEYLDLIEVILTEFPLGYIPPVIFYVYPRVRSIELSISRIDKIDSSFLPPKSNQLESMTLNNNSLYSIQADTFLRANNMTLLNLNENHISEIHCDAFRGLDNLKSLMISSNMLRGVKECHLKYLFSLELLEVEKNEITEVKDDSFKNLKALKNLSLARNAIKNINRRTFNGLEKLDDLNMSVNRLKILKAETFSELKMLTKLNMNGNAIEIIHKTVFSETKILKSIDLANNKIKRLSAESISDLPHLIILDVSNNVCINKVFTDIEEAKKRLEISCEPKPSDCMIPDIKNGRVISGLDETNITAGELYDDIFPVKVHCDPGYSMLRFRESDNLIFCLNNGTTNQWNKEFLECQKLCLGSKLIGRTSWASRCYIDDEISHECYENSKPGTQALVECRPGYKLAKGSRVPTNFTCLSDGQWDHQLFNCEPKCGIATPKAENYIIGGAISNVTEFPWNVAVYQEKKKQQVLICGGTILTERIVVSAAHCFYQGENTTLIPINQFKVVAGKFFQDFNAKEDSVQQTFALTRVMKPTQYQGTYNYNKHDIAILILDGFIEFWPHVAPICLNMNSTGEHLEPGMIGKVAGWGYSESTGHPSETLKSVEVPLVSKQECLEKASEDFRPYITEDKLCAGFGDGVGVCKGDSGASLVFKSRVDSGPSYYLWGIVSNGPQKTTGIGGCDLTFFTLYTNVQHYIHFISEAKIDYPSL